MIAQSFHWKILMIDYLSSNKKLMNIHEQTVHDTLLDVTWEATKGYVRIEW